MLAHPARPWDLRPRDDGPPAPDPDDPPGWPAVTAIVPARNEAAMLPRTLPALLGQDYPGSLRVVLVDDRSDDGTARVAEGLGDPRLSVVRGGALPAGWVGKVWALEQGARRAAAGGAPEYLLLTDADILHAPDSLRRLAAQARAGGGRDLASRMARLRCRSRAERLLIPPFVLFFLLLYPLRRANRPGPRGAAAAGGCILVRRETLERAGGFAAIRGALIDDLALAREVARVGGRIAFSLSGGTVTSLRDYPRTADVWAMVRRSAFTQLRRSWALLAITLLGLALLFLAPPLAAIAGAVALAGGGGAAAAAALAAGLVGWLAMAAAALPAMRAFELPAARALTLPLAGALYGAMTLDSALRGPRGGGWR